MAKICRYYIDIHKNECTLKKPCKFHVLKVFELRRALFTGCHCWCAHAYQTCRDLDYCSKQRRGTSQHAIISSYYRLIKKWDIFIDFELIIFPSKLGCYGYGSHCKVLCYANMNVTLFRVSANQISVFSITQQSR